MFLGCNKEKEVSYYENGKTSYIVEIENGKWNGKYISFYKSGNLETEANYLDGQVHGKTYIYYDSSEKIISQIVFYNHAMLKDTTFLFTKEGWMYEYQVFNDSGELIDYRKFYKADSQNTDYETMKPLFFSLRDTISKNEDFIAYATIGNRRYNSIEGVLGNINDRYLLKKPKLLKLNLVTVIIRIDKDSIDQGVNFFSGALVNLDSILRDPLVVVSFEGKFYVK